MRHFSAIACLLGGAGDDPEAEAAAAHASPVTHVHSAAPPFLIMHGDADRIVPIEQAELLHEALLNAGARSTLVRVEGADHVFEGDPDALQLVNRAVAFFAREFAS